MASGGALWGFAFFISVVNACNFVTPDWSNYSHLVFEYTELRKERNDMDCFIACGQLADCAAVAYDVSSTDCYVLAMRGNIDNYRSSSLLSNNNSILYIREEFACGIDVCADCSNAYQSGHTNNALFPLSVSMDFNLESYLVLFTGFCEMESNANQWLVFQRRVDGSEDFYRGWQSYAGGFGDMTKEFWLDVFVVLYFCEYGYGSKCKPAPFVGNEILSYMTLYGYTILRVEMSDFSDLAAYAEYDAFTVGDSSTNYTLHCTGYSGTAGDSMRFHNGAQFSTLDVDNDTSPKKCSTYYHGAFWYNDCHKVNPTGLYRQGNFTGRYPVGDGIIWSTFRGTSYSLKFMEMKIRIPDR
ncbi:hypothetical protein CAPTEDRAFT_219236 [Capitella teleta]|uniref:Fibrinogen C-terminal domain-containing protein n=1 Tax=Capitella teleta TaxID=283909 RepID=R7V2W9_CAPTE|nr:hypothetical protein CAPTEDRAFT_219236 [Capitella teleta]|eukprot:ELU12832.1 hypothetical protein CAPTEDRAFT_219236 [Capitella teleta]